MHAACMQMSMDCATTNIDLQRDSDGGEEERLWDACSILMFFMQDRADELASMLAAATESSERLQLENATLHDKIAYLEGDLEAARGTSPRHSF